MLRELNSSEFTHPAAPATRDAPEVMQAFVARHVPAMVLMSVLLAQFLLLSFQITRNHRGPLIKLWAVRLLDPFDRSLRGVSDATARAWETYHGLWGAERQNQELQTRLVEARFRIQQLSEQAAEAERLRALLDFKTRAGFSTQAAEVIAASPGDGSAAVYIDKGADEDLAADEPVITPQGVVGKIVAVLPHASQVLLVTDSASGVGAMLGSDHVQGVVKGTGDGLCRLDYIMNGESVSPGEPVLTSGLDQIYPKGLLIGTVAQVQDGNIYKRVTVRPAAPLDRLEMVLVVTRPPAAAGEAADLRR